MSMPSEVSVMTLFLTTTGIPCRGPRMLPRALSTSRTLSSRLFGNDMWWCSGHDCIQPQTVLVVLFDLFKINVDEIEASYMT